MVSLRIPLLTPQEYLERERTAAVKSEYISGEIFAMAGASREHNLITLNIAAELRSQLRERPCEVYSNDMRVQVENTGLYAYPDVVVVCGEPQFGDEHLDTLENPAVIVEVLSETTEAFDRGEKFARYRRLSSLREYLMVSQNRRRIEQYTRLENGLWLLTEVNEPDEAIQLASLNCELRVADVYLKVSFPVAEVRPDA
jgi:Uma2 family endonuclease